ncbi:hypothetical protein BST81_11140 [Leptolyngbya sp. 'hensonii']|uniref:STAS domain-containing protein n=1 Tax=Leptolyngbya sp. 'hensonii' TaxID=1922337 RepID=UPI00094FC114|nr:STAS domain-containing protein [Leptolyngbya sp. 'hensonii']OLP18342.1 hypothetical protein BST81_11140 [Leptolyngbya sp. 'hensonii']
MTSIQIFQPSRMLTSVNGTELLDGIDLALEEGYQHFLIDMQDAMFMDSSGLSFLVTAYKRVRSAGGTLSLCSLKGQAAMLVEITRMDKMLDIYSDRDAFQRAINTRQDISG